MNKTDYRELMDKTYLGAWDVPLSGDLVLTIKSVSKETVVGEGGKEDECMVIKYEDAEKPMICNATNAKMIAKLTGSTYIEDWTGVRIALYAKKGIPVGKEIRDGLRVRDYLPKLQGKLVCADCGKPITEQNGYSAATIAEQSRGAYGKALCWECSKKAKEAAAKKAKESDVL